MRAPWAVAAALAAVAALLVALRPRPASAPPPPSPVPLETARFDLVTGALDGPRVLRRALLAFPDGLDIVLHEDSVFRAERSGPETILRLEAGQVFLDGIEDLRVVTPHATVTARGAALEVRLTERGTSVTVVHGAALVLGTPFRKEITRGEALDVSTAGALGEPIALDPTAAVEWARTLQDAQNLLRDGGFEEELTRWEAPQYEETAVRADRKFRSGRRSALIAFNAIRDYRHASPRSMPFTVPAGSRLLFRGYTEISGLEAGPGGGACLEIRDENGAPVPGSRTPLFAGASGWRKFSFELEVPAGLRDARVVCTKADNGAPILGSFRLDDLAVFRLP